MSVRPQLYVVVIHGKQRDLPEDAVLWWIKGVADQRRQPEVLDAVDRTKPDETQRMQALMIAHRLSWLEYVGVTDDPAHAGDTDEPTTE